VIEAKREQRLSEDLMGVVGPLRRVIRRRVRAGWPHRPLPDSELELLRFVAMQPGARVLDAAAELGVVPNTVSTLVGKLTERGLLRRAIDPDDARAARLYLTPQASLRMAMWRRRRDAVVQEATAALEPHERHVIAQAIPALRRLVEVLEEG
jgi:DNA-binding MarR family transcriptional regulator